ncbi:MAG: ABC transporter permease [Jatrophihabitantaceae bacterium]
MTRLIRAEFARLRTTQVWLWMLVAALAVTALLVIAQLASKDGVQSQRDAVGVFTSSGSAYIVVFVLGVLGVTTEFRYQTITSTVLTTPSRWALISAKLITYALVGAAYAFACVLVQLAIALPWLPSKGYDIGLTSQHVPRALLGVFAVVTLFGIVGLGAGALIRNQIVAVSVGVVFLIVINNVLAIIPGVKYVFPFTPVGGADSLFTFDGDRSFGNGVTLLPGWGGVIVLLLWAFVPAVLGAGLTMTRDIT